MLYQARVNSGVQFRAGIKTTPDQLIADGTYESEHFGMTFRIISAFNENQSGFPEFSR
jgi:hypothetical protein